MCLIYTEYCIIDITKSNFKEYVYFIEQDKLISCLAVSPSKPELLFVCLGSSLILFRERHSTLRKIVSIQLPLRPQMIRFVNSDCLFAGRPLFNHHISNSPVFFIEIQKLIPEGSKRFLKVFKRPLKSKRTFNLDFEDDQVYSTRLSPPNWFRKGVRTMTDLSIHKVGYSNVPRRPVFSSEDLRSSVQLGDLSVYGSIFRMGGQSLPGSRRNLLNPSIPLHDTGRNPMSNSNRHICKNSKAQTAPRARFSATRNQMYGSSKNCFTAFRNKLDELIIVGIDAELSNFIIFENSVTGAIQISGHVPDGPLFLELFKTQKCVLCCGNSKTIWQIALEDPDDIRTFGVSRHNKEIYMMKIVNHERELVVSGDSKFLEIFKIASRRIWRILRLGGECYDFDCWGGRLLLYDEGISVFRRFKLR